MKHKILQGFRTHVFTVRFGLTVTLLQYLLWLRMTDRGDNLLEALFLMFFGIGLALAWFVRTLEATVKPPRRHLLPALGVELIATGVFLVFAQSEVPFLMAFPLSRPALERFVQEPGLPQTPQQKYNGAHRQVGLLRVIGVRRDKEGNIALCIHSNMSYAHYIVWCPNGRPARFDSYGPFLDRHWYRYSYGM